LAVPVDEAHCSSKTKRVVSTNLHECYSIFDGISNFGKPAMARSKPAGGPPDQFLDVPLGFGWIIPR
jgi:hypothetical protein